MSTPKWLQNIDYRLIFTVFGYIRQLKQNISLSDEIPTQIVYICLQSYCNEFFQTFVANDIALSDDKMTITKKHGQNWNNGAFGTTWIDSTSGCIAKWKLNINHFNTAQQTWVHVFIYILSNEFELKSQEASFHGTCDSPYYTIMGNGFAQRTDGISQYKITRPPKFTTNDNITLTLDTQKATINFKVNNGEDQCIFDEIKCDSTIKYKLGICLWDVNYSITLTDFEFDVPRSFQYDDGYYGPPI